MIALAGALLAGCGEDQAGSSGPLSKAEYEREFRAAVDRVEQSPRIETGNSLPEQATALAEGQKRMLGLADDLEDLRPPREIDQAHQAYLAALRGAARDMNGLIGLLRRGDERGADRLLDRPRSFFSLNTVALMRRARAAYEAKGYDLDLWEGAP